MSLQYAVRFGWFYVWFPYSTSKNQASFSRDRHGTMLGITAAHHPASSPPNSSVRCTYLCSVSSVISDCRYIPHSPIDLQPLLGLFTLAFTPSGVRCRIGHRRHGESGKPGTLAVSWGPVLSCSSKALYALILINDSGQLAAGIETVDAEGLQISIWWVLGLFMAMQTVNRSSRMSAIHHKMLHGFDWFYQRARAFIWFVKIKRKAYYTVIHFIPPTKQQICIMKFCLRWSAVMSSSVVLVSHSSTPSRLKEKREE
ncbi:hypothetical protein V8C35DRAFT_311366 [Trichoderma chlorosporum]